MTPLETLAKAGDPAAVNELLRLSMPRVRAIVFAALRGTGVAFHHYESLCADAMVITWGAISRWRGDASLTSMVSTPIRRAVWAFAAKQRGHERATDSLEKPVVQNMERGWTINDTLRANNADPDLAIDARRVLAAMKPAQAALLWRVAAEGEEQAEIADETGTSRQNIHLKYNRAVANARTLLAA